MLRRSPWHLVFACDRKEPNGSLVGTSQNPIQVSGPFRNSLNLMNQRDHNGNPKAISRTSLVLVGYFPYVGYRGTGSARAIGDVDRDPVEWKLGIFTMGNPHIFRGTFTPTATAVEFVARNTSMKFEFWLGDHYQPIMEFDATGATNAIREAREQCATL